MKHGVALPRMTHTHARQYTLQERRQARRESKKTIKSFFLFLFISNITILTAIAMIAYNW
jgi:hypothetical protein